MWGLETWRGLAAGDGGVAAVSKEGALAGLRGRGRGADVEVGPRGIAAVGGRGAGGGDAG